MLELVVVLAVAVVLIAAAVAIIVVGLRRRSVARLASVEGAGTIRAGDYPERDAAISDALRGRGANTGLNF